MIIQFYQVGTTTIKVVIKGLEVTIFDDERAKNGVTVESILSKDREKRMNWENFMRGNPTEQEIAKDIGDDLKTSYGFRLIKEVVDGEV